MASLPWQYLGTVEYSAARDMQRARVDAIATGTAEPVLWLLEHPDVVTVGRGGDQTEAIQSGLPVAETERGGGLTWHGPGQLVGYAILRLDDHDVHRHLRDLEEALIRWLATLGIAAGRKDKLTGVWVGEKKIASLGVAVRRWVTYHGFALNLSPDMAAFRRFRPCGLSPEVMISLRELGHDFTPASAAPGVARSFGDVFRTTMIEESAAAGAR